VELRDGHLLRGREQIGRKIELSCVLGVLDMGRCDSRSLQGVSSLFSG
jgi:hypothetical protein